MDIFSRPDLPIPAKLAALTTWDIDPYGPLVMNADVADAFDVSNSALRKWRSAGTFPQPVFKRSTASYYRVADLVAPFYRRFPGLLPDEPVDPLRRFLHVAIETAPPEGAESESGDNGGSAAGNDVPGRFHGVTLEKALRNEMVSIVADAVTRLVEREPESASVIESLAAELAAQRAEIESRGAEIGRLRGELEALRQPGKRREWWRFWA